MTFAEGEDIAARTAELAANTLAYHLADDATRLRLIEVFRAIGQSIFANTNGDQRAIIRRSPLSPAAIAELQAWLNANLDELRVATAEDRLLDLIAPTLLRFVSSRAIRGLSDQALVPRLLTEWVAGRSFAVIFAGLRDAGVRVGRDHVTVEDAVALCESGFGYDVAMIIASLADLAEDLDQHIRVAAALLQRQVKYGLTNMAAIAFHEAGFSDRHVASLLALAWPDIADRAGVRAVCREQPEIMRAVLAQVPSYFSTVAAEHGQWA